jgi:hypothetical protein
MIKNKKKEQLLAIEIWTTHQSIFRAISSKKN